ncbi:MAG: hypothetical protein V3U26_03015, partial [Dehalococcoidia bacterium]
MQKGWWAAGSPERMREWLRQPNLHPEKEIFLAYRGPQMMGYIQNTFEPSLKRVIMEGGVLPDPQNLSVEAELLERSLALAQQRGCKVAHVPITYGA